MSSRAAERAQARVARQAAQQKGGFNKAAFYRLNRLIHGYLSAFAFLTLMFFTVTGLLLNHPDWFNGPRQKPEDRTLMLPRAVLVAAERSADPARTLADAVEALAHLKGGYKSGEILDGEAHLRFEGVSGNSDVTIAMDTGATEVSVESATLVTMLHDLHRGKNSGTAWSVVIDVTCILVLVLSLIGYVLFFSMRSRLATNLALTVGSLALLLGIIWLFVP